MDFMGMNKLKITEVIGYGRDIIFLIPTIIAVCTWILSSSVAIMASCFTRFQTANTTNLEGDRGVKGPSTLFEDNMLKWKKWVHRVHPPKTNG